MLKAYEHFGLLARGYGLQAALCLIDHFLH